MTSVAVRAASSSSTAEVGNVEALQMAVQELVRGGVDCHVVDTGHGQQGGLDIERAGGAVHALDHHLRLPQGLTRGIGRARLAVLPPDLRVIPQTVQGG